MSCKDHNNNCCCMLEVVKDCICCDWTLQGSATAADVVRQQIIYTATGLCPIVSGKVEFCSATAEDPALEGPNSVVVQFLRGNRIIQSIPVFLDSCTSFTVAKFDKIQVARTTPADADDDTFTLSGNFCINTNFTLH
ncbi:S-Ena type endospore appendage [Thermolongibacillus altinsuensis]